MLRPCRGTPGGKFDGISSEVRVLILGTLIENYTDVCEGSHKFCD